MALRERRPRLEKTTDQPGPSKPRTRASLGKGESLGTLDVNAALENGKATRQSTALASKALPTRRGTAATTEPGRVLAGAKRRSQHRDDDLADDDSLTHDEDAARVKRLRTSEPDLDDEQDPDAAIDEADVADGIDPDALPVVPYQPAKDEGWEDLDAGDEDDPLMVSEYVNEVYDYLLELEVRLRGSLA